MSRGAEQTLLQINSDGQQAHEKILHITNHQRNANYTIMRYKLTPVRMANIQTTDNNKCSPGCGERATLQHCWWECKLVQPLWKAIWRFLKMLKIDLSFDPEIPLLGVYPKYAALQFEKDRYTPMFIAALFTIAKKWK